MLTSLRAILRSAARSLGVERAANAALIEQMWAEVVGPEAAAHSRVRGLRGTVLMAEADAGPWVQDLSARRGAFMTEINRRLGGRVVSEIRFAHAPLPFLPRDPSASGPSGAPGPAGGAAGTDEPLSEAERQAVERAVAEIGDPEIRDSARRAMISQLKWRRARSGPGGTA